MRLCGCHLAFYACLHRGDRKGGKLHIDVLPMQQPLTWKPAYQCAARPEVHAQCEHADRNGAAHRAAGIEVPNA